MKPWTASRGPIKAIEWDVQKAAAINALLVEPAGILPSTVNDEIKPFEVGLFDHFRARIRQEASVTQLRRAVAAYVHTKRYYFASAQPGAMRHDFNGRAIGPVSQTDMVIAQSRFVELKQKQAVANGELATAGASPPSKIEQIRAALLEPAPWVHS